MVNTRHRFASLLLQGRSVGNASTGTEAVTEGGAAFPLPRDWSVTRLTNRSIHRVGLDRSEPGTALIESRVARGHRADPDDGRFASLMQSVMADSHRGLWIRLTARLRTENASAGTIWMRVDAAPGAVLRFDNMLKRDSLGALRGTVAWTERCIVLDVPPEAASIHYGFLLQNDGRVWARDFRLESVGQDVLPTAGHSPSLARPANLDVAEVSRPPA